MAASLENPEIQENSEDVQQTSTENIMFDEMVSSAEPDVEFVGMKKKREPRRIIHFVNGDTLEEYSTDEEEDTPEPDPIDPRGLDWLPWFWFWLVMTATKSLAVADFLGEKLAWFFGITTPKYQYVIDEYHRMKDEEEEEARLEKEEEESQLSSVATSGDVQNPTENSSDEQQNINTPSVEDPKLDTDGIDISVDGGDNEENTSS